ncbi:MAG: MGMT family protein [Candidatus Methanofastidiosia archaeon]|jgi:methylated-DNA-protein-cysteine methyltransferase-like protein
MVEDDTFFREIKEIIKKIPEGKVATYSQIAQYAGDPGGARQVVWVLRSSSQKDNLPWHRVVNKKGRISLKPGQGYETQKSLLKKEGVIFDSADRINFDQYLWRPYEKEKSNSLDRWL